MQTYDRQAMKMDEIATGLLDAEKKGEAKGKAEGLAEGEAKGEAKKAREMVLEMHRKGLDKPFIAEISHLSLEEVAQIIDQYHTSE
jgi:predicted transposase YdaD